MKTTKTKTNQKETEETFHSPLEWWGAAQEKSLILARWMSLYEAINYIGDKADEKNIPFEDIKLCPLKIRDYMDSVEDIFTRKLLENDYKIKICPSESEIEDNLDVILN